VKDVFQNKESIYTQEPKHHPHKIYIGFVPMGYVLMNQTACVAKFP
jgi:hypothetical protein